VGNQDFGKLAQINWDLCRLSTHSKICSGTWEIIFWLLFNKAELIVCKAADFYGLINVSLRILILFKSFINTLENLSNHVKNTLSKWYHVRIIC
jgi:hypothetical protein